MTSNELRIGNWIYNGIGEPFQANGETINNFDLGQGTLGKFEPIPIAGYWLIKMGFESYLSDWFCNDILVIEHHPNRNVWFCRFRVSEKESYELREVKFLHEIQNIHFSLTGEELTIK